MEVLLIRHTKPDIEHGVVYGQTDIGICDSFAEEVQAIQKQLPFWEGVELWSSPLSRCRLLADALQTGAQPIREDVRLKELDFGDWELKTWKELRAQENFADWMQDFAELPPPGGESYRQLYNRTVDFLNDRVSVSSNRVALVTHGGFIRSAIVHALEIPLKNMYRFEVAHASVSLLEYTRGQWKVQFLNR